MREDLDVWREWVPCNLCGRREFTVLFTAIRSGRQVVRCRGCGLVFYNPQPSGKQAQALYSAEYFAREYPGELAEEQDRLAHVRLARIEREAGVGHLMDVGCGLGGFLRIARQRGWKATGLDVSPEAVRAAASASGAVVLQGDLSRPRPAGVPAFDVVSMWDAFEHLVDPVGDLRRVHDWLRPGGMVVIQTQNANSVTAAWMRQRWEQFVEPHLFHFSTRTLKLALETAGFEQVTIEASDEFSCGTPATCRPLPTPARGPGRTLRDCLRRLRDLAFISCGHDPYTIMVATARCPRGE